MQMGVIDLASGKHIELTGDLDRNCFGYGSAHAPFWCGEYLLCSVETEGNIHVYAVKAEGDGKPELVVGGSRWISGWDLAGGTLAMISSDPVTLPELISIDVSTGIVGQVHDERPLTNLTGPLAKKVKIGVPEAFMARSADGTEVPCWAVAPIDAVAGKRYPTLLNVHGGPFTSYGNKFFDEFQMWAGAGFGVLYCNPRGGSGYSEAWGRAIRWPEWDHDAGSGWGGVDFEDVMACVDDGSKKFGWVDPDNIGIMGGSYGGYMTSWAIGHTKRFKAALSERACNNLLTLEFNSDAATAFRVYVGKSHVDDPGAYLRQSPITYVKEMTTPLMILHSEDDLRCPISQADELFASLRLLGREPEFVRFTGESHELTRSGAPKHRISRAEIVIDWFKRQLGST
jgi:dipeptidyl aminopeptidase/acylaminoacyl peptidase